MLGARGYGEAEAGCQAHGVVEGERGEVLREAVLARGAEEEGDEHAVGGAEEEGGVRGEDPRGEGGRGDEGEGG